MLPVRPAAGFWRKRPPTDQGGSVLAAARELSRRIPVSWDASKAAAQRKSEAFLTLSDAALINDFELKEKKLSLA